MSKVDPTPDEQLLALGRNLRSRRKARGLTLVQLGRMSELSATFISQVERGRHQPSVPTLHRLAKALDTDAYTMLIPPSGEERRVEINRGPARRAFSQEEDVPTSRAMPLVSAGNQLRVIEVSGGPVTWQGPFIHRNDEFMYVLEGEIEFEIDGKIDKLGANDSLLYPGGMAMRWRALTIETRVIVVIVDDGLTSGR